MAKTAGAGKNQGRPSMEPNFAGGQRVGKKVCRINERSEARVYRERLRIYVPSSATLYHDNCGQRSLIPEDGSQEVLKRVSRPAVCDDGNFPIMRDVSAPGSAPE